MKILISGATGFLGGNLLNRAVADGHSAAALVRRRMVGATYPVYVPNDWENIDLLAKTMEGQDVFIHCAGLAHNKRGDMEASNVTLSLNLGKAAVQAKLPHFVFISSATVLGPHGVFHVNTQPNPTNIYGDTKLRAEQALYRLFRNSATKLTILRLPIIIGQDAPGPAQTIRKILARGLPLPFADLRAQRSFVTIEDIYTNIINEASATPVRSALLHLSSDHISSRELIEKIAEQDDLHVRNFYVPRFIFEWLAHIPTLQGRLRPLIRDHILYNEKIMMDKVD